MKGETMFADKLMEKIKEKDNPSVIGLDPIIDNIPLFIREKSFKAYGENMKGAAEAVYEFNRSIIDSIYDIVPAVKPQSAYYEIYGPDGMAAFQKTVEYAKSKGLIVIADVKRNDIGSTAAAYSSAYIGKTKLGNTLKKGAYDVDAVTVNPYLGYDSVEPFIKDCKEYGKGIFILVKTSNPSSGDFQDVMTVNKRCVYEEVALKINEWGKELIGRYGYSGVGAVVGATYPEQLKNLRKILHNAFILVPVYYPQEAACLLLTAKEEMRVDIIWPYRAGSIKKRFVFRAYLNGFCSKQPFYKFFFKSCQHSSSFFSNFFLYSSHHSWFSIVEYSFPRCDASPSVITSYLPSSQSIMVTDVLSYHAISLILSSGKPRK
jgi:orotidine-5'-phosphate decarboxylase